VPDDVGGRPFQDGWEPDDDRGGADEEFASVVFDEDFVRAAAVHEPTAVERLLAAAQARAEAEARRARGAAASQDDFWDEPFGPPGEGDYDGTEAGPYGRHGGALRPYRGRARWHRPVAWILALVIGIGMVALAFSAVYRGTARPDQVPGPASTGIDSPAAGHGDTPGDDRPPASTGAVVSAVPRSR
jgi:hypothetical protein